MKIAIIGAGISGLGAAYLLAPHHEITVFERNTYIGGHSRTIDVSFSANENAADENRLEKTPVDTGFIVFNDWNYPNLFGLFDALRVPYHKSDMSFGVCIKKGWLEYASGGLFAQRRNIFRPQYWKMLWDITRFNKRALAYIDKDSSVTLGQCLDELKMGKWFRHYYLLAMGAAIWSCPIETIMKFPAKTYVRFFRNHGLLNLVKRPQWYSVKGGSREYVSRITQHIQSAHGAKITAKAPVTKIAPQEDGRVLVRAQDGTEEIFDHAIMACHADEALSMIETPSENEQHILGGFKYQDNKVVVHNDLDFMSQRKKCWASWVYLSEQAEDKSDVVSLSYWMNNLQQLETHKPVIVTLNPGRSPKAGSVMNEHVFDHPIFDKGAIDAQERIEDIQGKRGLWFCGAYQRYGFHEDGLWSAVRVAKSLGADIPWEQE